MKVRSSVRHSLSFFPNFPHRQISIPHLPETEPRICHLVNSITELPAKIREPQLPVATSTPAQLRDHFSHNLRRLEGPPVIVTNNVDDSSPPVSFEFINSSIICQGVEPVDKGFMVGCECTADRKVDRARICGSDDSECSCVYQADSKDVGLSYYPYLLSRQCLTKHFLTTRDHIHECNEFCCCGPDCKNRVVQHGRKVPLEIFKTADRGWGKQVLTLVSLNGC